ncbi:MAG: hypothetical protein AAGI01_13780, partial [Myxococcota bacterium]
MVRCASILWVLTVALLALPACGFIKNLRERPAPSSRDLELEGAPFDRKTADRIEEITGEVNRTLDEIERLLGAGRFRSATYREASLQERLDELAELDPKHPLLTRAPERLSAMYAANPERAWIEGVLLAECERYAAGAEKALEQEVWRDVGGRVDDYIACRARALESGMNVDMSALDARVGDTLDAHMAYLLEQAERYRREGNYRFAVGLEATLEDRADAFAVLAPSSPKPGTYVTSMRQTRASLKDPREAGATRAKAEYEAWRQEAEGAFL